MATHGNIEVVYFYRKNILDRKLGNPTKHNKLLFSVAVQYFVRQGSNNLTAVLFGNGSR